MISSSLESASGSWGDNDFAVSFRENYLDGLSDDMKNFLVENLYWNGEAVSLGESERVSFFENVVYPFARFENGVLVFDRGKVGKVGSLSAGGLDDVRFDVDYVFEFEKEYRVSKLGDRFILGVVE